MNWLVLFFILTVSMVIVIKIKNRKLLIIVVLILGLLFSYEVFSIYRTATIVRIFESDQIEIISLTDKSKIPLDSDILLGNTATILGRKKPNVRNMNTQYKLNFYKDHRSLLTLYINTINKGEFGKNNEFDKFEYEEFNGQYAIIKFWGRYYHVGQDFYNNLGELLSIP